jgi:hypothetical protein
MSERLLVLAAHDQAALGAVRAVPGLQVAAEAGHLWLRGLPATGELPLAVRTLPATAMYTLDEQNRLFPTGQLTPTGRLPALTWQPIRVFLPLEIPTAALPAQAASAYQVKLVPSARATRGAALLTTLDAWLAYAEIAPEIRLQGLRFAVSSEARVLLLGTPLPPIAGQEQWLMEDILLPAGFDFEAPFLATLVARQLNATGADLLLFAANGSWERVPQAHLVPATRGAVRRTAASFNPAP